MVIDLNHEYEIVNGTLEKGKTCSSTFSCHDPDMVDG